MDLEQLVYLVIVLAAVFAILAIFVPIDARIVRAIWIFIGAMVAIVLIGFLFGMIGGVHGPLLRVR